MSTVSTSINWGASFITNDLYLRFLKPNASQSELVLIGRLSSVLVTTLGAIAAFFATDVATVFRLVIAIGTGSGLILMLRWFWWRINAAAELTAIVASFFVGMATSLIPALKIEDFGLRILFITICVTVLWVIVLFSTPPESPETLESFYRHARPGGIGWQTQRLQTGVLPVQDLTTDLQKVLAAILLLFGALFAVGGFLLLQPTVGWVALVLAVIGGMGLRQLSKVKIRPMPRPGLEDEETWQ